MGRPGSGTNLRLIHHRTRFHVEKLLKPDCRIGKIANSLGGPWSELKRLATEPDSPDSFNTQHDFIIPVTGSEGTTYLYVGDRYSQHHGKGTGRNIFLPLIWDDGVPKLKWYESWKIDIGTGRYQCVDE